MIGCLETGMRAAWNWNNAFLFFFGSFEIIQRFMFRVDSMHNSYVLQIEFWCFLGLSGMPVWSSILWVFIFVLVAMNVSSEHD